MPRLFKKLACLALLTLIGQSSWGFALLGPLNEPYQVPDIGYGPQAFPDIGGPKNLGEEYRHNTPVIYYSFDANFLDYFGSNGVAAVDSAVQILNGVTNVSQLSSDISEYPIQVLRENYLAEALSLIDVKTWALKGLVEQLGLAEPERFIWCLHDRFILPGATCPNGMEYFVIKRNFDPVPSPLSQYQPSSYVNGTLYSYFINEVCMSPPGPPLAVCVPTPVDPLDFSFTAVAGLPLLTGGATTTYLGQYYIGLTRDDVGALRYLLRTNLVNFESAGPNTLAAVTNPVPQLLFTSNLTLLSELALTTDPVTLQAIIPNLNIIASSNYFVNVFITNTTGYFTNFPWDPVGTSAHLVFATNLVPTVQIRYDETFGNLLQLVQSPTGPKLVQITKIPPATNKAFITIERDNIGTIAEPFGPAGSTIVTTNSTFTTYLTNEVVGDYVVLPTNLCSVDILYSQLTNVITTTNFIGTITNSLVVTNTSGLTNAGTTLLVNLSQLTYFTNHAFVILPVNCVASGAAFFQGIDRIRFVRRDYDSLLGRFFSPTTNNYVLNSITNNTLVPEPIQRTVGFPDILFSARDLLAGPAAIPTDSIYQRSINFNTAFVNPGLPLAGPGTIEPTNGPTIIFNKVGPTFLNSSPNAFFLQSAEASQFLVDFLGSFDGTTNAPIVYPNGTSIVNLENQILIAISPALLPDGQVGATYAARFTANGGVAPYVWALAPNSPGLPPGLFLLSDGTLGGTPALSGTFDFTISMTDAAGRTVDRSYSITIIP